MEKGKIIAGALCLTGAAVLVIHTLRKGTPPPPPPPPDGEDVGMLQGHILNSSTGDRLAAGSVTITIDHEQSIINIIDSSGTYRTPYLPFGMHHFSVAANNYQTGEFDFEISESFVTLDFLLELLPEAPTDWTEGIEVREIHVNSPVYAGEPVTIGVAITYPHPLPLPADIYGSILINGIELTGEWSIDIRNPRVYFDFTPTVPGTYLVRALDKSASIEVLEKVISIFYNPFGGRRFPVCTEITVPTINGDVVFQRYNYFFISWPSQAIIDALPQAYPSLWNPQEAEVRQWEMLLRIRAGGHRDIHIMPTDYDCPEYWSSKAELAHVIAEREPTYSHSWVAQFGEKIKFTVGWRDWNVTPNFYSRCGGGYCSRYLVCPICDEPIFYERKIQGSASDHEKGARVLLEHVETSHQPLTEPFW